MRRWTNGAAVGHVDGRDVRQVLAEDRDALLRLLRSGAERVAMLLGESDAPSVPSPSGRAGRVRTVLWVVAVVATFLLTIRVIGDSYELRWIVPLAPENPGVTVPALAALVAAPLWLVRTGPLRAWRWTVGAALLFPVVARPATHHDLALPVTLVVVAAVVLLAVAVHRRPSVLLAIWGVSTLAVTAACLVAGTSDVAGPTTGTAISGGVVLLVGYLVGTRREVQRRLEEGERERAASETQRAVLEERARIARELHDVVAHHLSLISVQAETAPYRTGDLGTGGEEVLASIAATSRTALTDMRRLLGVLRDGQRGADRAPQPDLGQLDDLVAGARRAGVDVELQVTGRVRPLLAGTELSAYRIVQEGLSNAATHAPDAAVTVEVAYAPASVTVRVRNEAPPQPVTAVPGSGHGLVGMRERVALLGGHLAAGPTDDGGYQVEAVLPLAGDGAAR